MCQISGLPRREHEQQCSKRLRNWPHHEVMGLSDHLKMYPFLRYALQFWGKHVRKSFEENDRKDYFDQELNDLAVELLTREDNTNCISRNLPQTVIDSCYHVLLNNPNRAPGTSPEDDLALNSDIFPELHIAVHFGLQTLFHGLMFQTAVRNIYPDLNSKLIDVDPISNNH